jgi:hypothetical protein
MAAAVVLFVQLGKTTIRLEIDERYRALLEELTVNEPLPWMEPVFQSMASPDNPLVWSKRTNGQRHGVVVTPDNRFIIVVNGIHLQVWDYRTLCRLDDLEEGESGPHTQEVCGIVVLPQGGVVVSGARCRSGNRNRFLVADFPGFAVSQLRQGGLSCQARRRKWLSPNDSRTFFGN